MAERIRLGDLLVEMGLVTSAQLDDALQRQQQDKRRLGELLVEAGAISEAKVTQVISQQLSVPWVSLSHIDFSRPLLDLVPSETAQRYGVVPIYVRRGKNKEQTLYVAMQDPSESDALDEISRFSGLPVRAMIAPPADIRGAIRVYYLGLPPEEATSPVPADVLSMADLHSIPPSAPHAPAPPVVPPPPPVRAASAPARPPEAVAPPVVADDSDGEEEEAPDSKPVESRAAAMPRPKQAGRQKMVTLTLLDGTQITLPASPKTRGDAAPASAGLTARDLVEALRAHGSGADASEVLGENVNWERLFAALLSLLLKKHLISDWEFVHELQR
ncbi:MAG TPA: hypothetical protein VLC09_06800 [Polyangiaceae bacterium]|nr:hypothetical protein [Polyangiaceae bacterium]